MPELSDGEAISLLESLDDALTTAGVEATIEALDAAAAEASESRANARGVLMRDRGEPGRSYEPTPSVLID